MASFQSTVITERGHALMAKIATGSTKMRFTKIRISDSSPSDSSLPTLTALSSIKQTVDISSITVINNATVKVSGAISNAGLETGYFVRTIGLYAQDPDLGEILYSVTKAIEADYMPPDNGISSSSLIINLLTVTSNAANVTINVDPAAVATQADVIEINAKIADLTGFVGYTKDDIYGVEVDFANRTFTRLAGAVGKTPGADFDSILAFGGRYRCNLTDEGVEVAKYGDIGYTETGALTQAITIEGATYASGTSVQVMVKQPKFYYKVVPLKLEKNDAEEIDRIEFTAGASSDGNITITLNGQSFNVAVLASDNTATAIATKVRNATFNGWTTGGSDATVTFTRNKKGACVAPTFNGGTTGVTANVARTQVGYIGKGFKLRKARYYVSMTKKAGFKVHPAFVQNGVEREFIYLSAYEGSLYDVSASAYILDDAQIADFTVSNGDKLSSIANAKPISGLTQDLTRRKCGILAENRGNGWYQQYAATTACSQLLFIIEYASMNAQSKIGVGVTSKASSEGNKSELTGATTNLGNASGSVTNTNGYNVVSYRGEENLWGNIWKFVDGMNIYCDASQGIHDLYIADNAFAESKNTDNYKDAGITLATKEGYVSAMAYNEEFDWLFVPTETLGDTALPVGDYFYQNVSSSAEYRVARLGGYWIDSFKAGAFYWYMGGNPPSRDRHIGGRLVYVPPVAAQFENLI